MFKSMRPKYPPGWNSCTLSAPMATSGGAPSTKSSCSTRVPSSNGDDVAPIVSAKSPKVPVLSTNGKKLVEKFLNHCKVTSEFPLVELLKNSSGVSHGGDVPDDAIRGESYNELNAADKLQLAVDATAFDVDELFGFDYTDVPEERRIGSPRLQSCRKMTHYSSVCHHQPRSAQLRKRVCFRSEVDEDGDAATPVSVVTELHLYEHVMLKHRYAPTNEEKHALDTHSEGCEFLLASAC